MATSGTPVAGANGCHHVRYIIANEMNCMCVPEDGLQTQADLQNTDRSFPRRSLELDVSSIPRQCRLTVGCDMGSSHSGVTESVATLDFGSLI